MTKKHHGIVARLTGDENGPNKVESIEPLCIEHSDDERCTLGVCDEVIYEASDAPATTLGWRRAYDANWDRVFGKRESN